MTAGVLQAAVRARGEHAAVGVRQAFRPAGAARPVRELSRYGGHSCCYGKPRGGKYALTVGVFAADFLEKKKREKTARKNSEKKQR